MAAETRQSKNIRKTQKHTEPRPQGGWFNSPLRQVSLLSLLLAAATLALYFPVSQHPFLNYDDDEYITDNSHVKAGLTTDTVGWAFTTYDAANWHPLTWLSHACDYQLFELNSAGHHDTNLVLHVLNVVLLFWILWRATGYAGRSLIVAALFALHPINVESVAWIAERKNLLSMLFFLLALGAWRWYARQPGAGRYIVVTFLFGLGLMAKPQVITLPFVLLLWDYWPLQRMATRDTLSSPDVTGFPQKNFGWLVVEKLPLLALSAASAVITMRAQKLGGGINPDVPLLSRLANTVVAYVRYLGHAFWPTRLAPFYPLPTTSPGLATVTAAALLLLAITAWAIAQRRHRYLLVGWLWFLGTLVPMIGIVQVGRQAMADRYAYLPFLGVFLMVCWGLAEYAERREVSLAWQTAISVAVLLAPAVLAHRQISYWDDNVGLWTHTVQVTGDNYIAEDYLGMALEKDGKPQEAMPHFVRAIEIEPAYVFPYIHLGIYEHQQGNLQQALEWYQKVIILTQSDIAHYTEIRHRIFANMASAYIGVGDLQRARESLDSAVALNAGNAEEWTNLGILAQKAGDLAPAIAAYNQALRIAPSQREYELLARALHQAGREQEAQAAIRQALALSGDGSKSK